MKSKTFIHTTSKGPYRLTMTDTGQMKDEYHARVSYVLIGPEGDILFCGNDFGASPCHPPLSKFNAKELLGFLTLKPGDTDADWFDKYTERQMKFAREEAEELSLFCE